MPVEYEKAMREPLLAFERDHILIAINNNSPRDLLNLPSTRAYADHPTQILSFLAMPTASLVF